MEKNLLFKPIFTYVFFLLTIYNLKGQDYLRAPNSFIIDPQIGQIGVKIPVKKAYQVWQNHEYFNEAIPAGQLSASIVWEDVDGLINSLQLSAQSNPENSKIVVKIDPAKGKGNAVIALHVGANGNNSDPIYWSWHVWVTDDPSNGYSFGHTDFHGDPMFERDKNFVGFVPQYMDRNLGATNASFLGNDWSKSAGLFFEWGRKDPFPPLVYKDNTFYEIYGDSFGYKRYYGYSANNILQTYRPYNTIDKNLKYSVRNPLVYINTKDSIVNGQRSLTHWFSKARFNYTQGTDNVNFDLWGDNAEGKQTVNWNDESRTYEKKSTFDPCPNGWRVPSYMSKSMTNHKVSPWGRDSGISPTTAETIIDPAVANAYYPNIKIYPRLGVDFSQVTNRPFGLMPTNGNFEYYESTSSGEITGRSIYQDQESEINLTSGTLNLSAQQRNLMMIVDLDQPDNNGVGRYVYQGLNDAESKTGMAIRCMRDPNLDIFDYDFQTDYVYSTSYEETKSSLKISSVVYEAWLELPNAYLVEDGQETSIPLKKPSAVYNYLLLDDNNLFSPRLNQISINILWADNPNLIRQINTTQFSSIRSWNDAVFKVSTNDNVYGNAVITMNVGSAGNASDPVYWSWHIWKPASNPINNPIKYQTEDPLTFANLVNMTVSEEPPLQTIFMDRNLGAVYPYPDEMYLYPDNTDLLNQAKLSAGLQYQCGRKEPMPIFYSPNTENLVVYKATSSGFESIDNSQFQANYTKAYQTYSLEAGINPSDRKFKNVNKTIKYALQNPMIYLYNTETESKDWISNENNLGANRWGHGTKKSAFDPCPDGWRVPDVSFVNLNFIPIAAYGTSPFYNGHNSSRVAQNSYVNLSNYGGDYVYKKGWNFNQSNYPLKGFPATGIRGIDNNNVLVGPKYMTGIWLAGLSDVYSGYGLALSINGTNMVSGMGFSPKNAMNIRCAKDLPRYTGVLAQDFNQNAVNDFVSIKANNKSMVEGEINIFPNPATTFIGISTAKNTTYEIYDINGKLVKSGMFTNQKISINTLNIGVYVIKYQTDEEEGVVSKFYKK